MTTAFQQRAIDRISSRDRLPEELDPDHVRRYFALSEQDLTEVHTCRGARNKIAFAVQLCSLRWFGFLLPDMEKVPKVVVEVAAQQLNVDPSTDMTGYRVPCSLSLPCQDALYISLPPSIKTR